ncbi:MAG TPA: hypothetical protein VNM87_12915 [Candidatus Udaeobacter sp.]|nr:hypothetical protein [Candidatus Udaeobacter sp.]
MSRVVASILYPFDMGLELDLSGGAAGALVAELADASSHSVSFEGRELGAGKMSGRIYRFGVGLVELRFEADLTLDDCARISCFTGRVEVDGQPLSVAAEALAREVMNRARPFATYTYDLRLEDQELYPVFVLAEAPAEPPESMIERERRALVGIVAAEPDYDRLSRYALERERLGNLGYLEQELILVWRFGAVLATPEARTITDLLGVVLAQQWSLRSYDAVLDHELDQAQRQLSDLPPYFHFWRMPGRYRDFSREAIAFARDKLTITASMHSVSADVPLVEEDWHMRALYEHARASFRVDALERRVETKLDRVEAAYNSARELLSTNFSILLDMIFLVFLIWSILDTVLLALVAFR